MHPEESSTKETARKGSTAEEELEPEVLEVFHPTHEWQALHPGTKLSPVPGKHNLNSNRVCPWTPQGCCEGAATLWPAGGEECGGCCCGAEGPSFSS